MAGSSRAATGRDERLSPHVAKKLREMILTGAVRSGDRLRAEHLAEELDVSATPVREALMTIAGEGLVQFRPGRGFRVASLSRQDVLDVYDTQAHVAGILTARAVPHLTEVHVEELTRHQCALNEAIVNGDPDAIEAADFDFHRLINRMADSPKLLWMLKLTHNYVPFRVHAEVLGWPEAARDDHVPLLRAIAGGSPDTARDFMQAHIRHAGDLLVDYLATRGVIDS